MTRTSTATSAAPPTRKNRPVSRTAQQAHLQVAGHLGDLIQEQRAVMGALEHPGVITHRAREAALLMPEQLGLDQARGNGPTIDRNEGVFGARTLLVHRASRELLAAAALADQQDAGVGGRDPPDLLTDELHLW